MGGQVRAGEPGRTAPGGLPGGHHVVMSWGSTPQDATAGRRVIADRYELREKLGAGGMGAVWAARDVRFGRVVAVKEAHVRYRTGPDRVVREATAAMRVKHPSVVTVHDVVEEGGNLWIVMEHIQGESLKARLAREGSIREVEAARIGLAVVEGLRAAHAKGVLHRDIKPANVLIEFDGRVVLTDFGIADIADDVTLTETGDIVGSRGYIAPERWRGERAEAASDLWAVGVLLFEMVEGWSPYKRETMVESIAALIEGVPDLQKAARLGPIITSLLDDQPTRRPAVEEIVAALRKVIGDKDARPGNGSANEQRQVGADRGLRIPKPGLTAWIGISLAVGLVVSTLVYGMVTDRDAYPRHPKTSGSPKTSVPSPTATNRLIHVREKAFTLDIPSGYAAKPKNTNGQYVYVKGKLKIIVTGGRDGASQFSNDPVTYQKDEEFELQPWRDSTWGSVTDLRQIENKNYPIATGAFTWTTADGEEVYARNNAILAHDRYHVILVMGPEQQREQIDHLHDQVVKTYKPRG
ncbi:putative sensor kinase [Streptomyces scabiei 87.22]|nr:serine/threonine-protein kinase StkP [Streptomyces acidiscabies]GAQ66587.1 serine/threonine-protein kinase StkP [Streptomyces scabiei]CBG70352.1 putative sensor kinase [Streptomyces scabiei 87.22]